MLYEFWHNFTHNLFKPLLLFFYMGFLIPLLKIQFEFPYVLYQGLTLYLLLAIGWRGGDWRKLSSTRSGPSPLPWMHPPKPGPCTGAAT